MKTQKLIRKYRLLKPHERIQYGDYFADIETKSLENIKSNWIQIEDVDDTSLKLEAIAKDYNTIHFARFVDCVPAPQKKH